MERTLGGMILNDEELVRRLRTGSRQADRRKGRFVA